MTMVALAQVAEPRVLGPAEVAHVKLTPTMPMFAVVRSDTDAGVFLEVLQPSSPYATLQPDSWTREATLVTLRSPGAATVHASLEDGGVRLTGAAVRRIDIPGRFDGFSMQFPRPEVVVARRSVGFSCPETSTDTAYLVRGDTLTPLVEVSATGEAGYHDGSSLFWGGDAGAPTYLVGFPRLELAKGVEASRHVTVIHEVVEDDQFICSTRRRYRFDGAKLVLLDVTHASDAGCADAR